jgi:hypothetical protein
LSFVLFAFLTYMDEISREGDEEGRDLQIVGEINGSGN